jgi:hypothetical protein
MAQPVINRGQLDLPVFDVKAAGAVGDGIADDTDIILALVAEIEAAGGGILFFPVGTYLLTSKIVISADTDFWIQGTGDQTCIIKHRVAGDVAIQIGDTTAQRTADIQLNGFLVDGDGTTSHAVLVQRVQNGFYHDFRIQNCGGDGLRLDRCYATSVSRVRVGTCGGHGIHATQAISNFGNDHLILLDNLLLGNTGTGIYIEGAAPGLFIMYNDIEGNGVGLQIDTGYLVAQSEAVMVMSNYFENQVGRNVDVGNDAGSPTGNRQIEISFIRNIVNPGSGTAADNGCDFNRCKRSEIIGNHFSRSDFTIGSLSDTVVYGNNKYSSCTGPSGATDPMRTIYNPGGGYATNYAVHVGGGWDTRMRFGAPYSGAAAVIGMNLKMTNTTTGELDNTARDGSSLVTHLNGASVYRATAGVNPRTLEQVSADVPEVTTGSLPVGSSLQDGKLIIDSSNGNLITYTGGNRFTLTGGGALQPEYELQEASAGSPLQTVFNTTVATVSNYASGNELHLQVFVNGLLQLENLPGSPIGTKAYSVTGANQITFNVGVVANADVAIHAF